MDGQFINNFCSQKEVSTPLDLQEELENARHVIQLRPRINTHSLRLKFIEIINNQSLDANKRSYYLHQLQYVRELEELSELVKEFNAQ